DSSCADYADVRSRVPFIDLAADALAGQNRPATAEGRVAVQNAPWRENLFEWLKPWPNEARPPPSSVGLFRLFLVSREQPSAARKGRHGYRSSKVIRRQRVTHSRHCSGSDEIRSARTVFSCAHGHPG